MARWRTRLIQALKHGDARQQHLVGQQPGGRPVEQQTRPVIAGPAQDIEPPGQPEPGSRILLEITKAILLANGRGVPPSLPAIAVGIQARRLRLAALARHSSHHGRRRLGRIVEKGAQKARRPELDGKTKPVVCPSHSADQFVICGVKVEVTDELLLVGIAPVSAVAGKLFVEQKAAGHGVRIAEVIREKEAGLQSLEEPWADTTTPAGRMVLTMFAGVAEFERAFIRHRTDEGCQAAKQRGVSFGQPQKLRPDQKTLALSLVREGRSISEVARTFNVHPATIRRCLNEPQTPNQAL